jgi:hypothetical protein
MTKRHHPRPPAPPKGGTLLEVPSQADLDAAKRLSDAVALHLVADFETAIRSIVVVKLEDGSTDGVLYSSWDDACSKGAPDPRWYAPLRITPDGINERDARLWMRVNRMLPGIKSVNPAGAPEHIVAPHIHLPGGRRLQP